MRNRRRSRSHIWQWGIVAGLAVLLGVLIVISVVIAKSNEVPYAETNPTTLMPTEPSQSQPSEPDKGFELQLTLNGDRQVTLEYGAAFADPGALAQAVRLADQSVIPLQVQVDNRVNWSSLGVYQIVYTVEYEGQRSTVVRTVQIVDTTAPVITLMPQSKPLMPGQVYEEDGYTAVDNYDGDIASQVQRIVEQGIVRYTVTDSSGNTASAERVLQYAQLEGPVLTLKGEDTVTLQAGTKWEEPGYSAMDATGADLTDRAQITGKVNWYAAGTYTLQYRVVDGYGKEATASRKVIVKPIRQPDEVKPEGKVVYLTFDDGPVKYTKRLLQILEQYNVKATFFVCGNSDLSLLDDIVAGGHTLALHSMSHEYDKIYSSEEAFFSDLYALQQVVYEKTGIKSNIMRFPGGSSNRVSKKYNVGIMTRLTQAVKDQGFRYFDWNVDSDDAGNTTTAEGVVQNVIKGIQNRDVSVVLQHDIKSYSVDAVEEIIIWGLQNGYTFMPLEQNSPKCEHEVRN